MAHKQSCRVIPNAEVGSAPGGEVQPLLRTRPVAVQLLLAVVIPAAAGALAGWLLGVNKTAYLVFSILALLGGYAAGTEHNGAAEGALRGVIGGSLFGGLILLVNDALDKTPKADLPDPKIWLLAITVGIGTALGTMGGRARANFKEPDKKKEAGPAFDIRRVQRSEIVGFVGAGILLFSLFLNWFSTSCPNAAAAKAAIAAGNTSTCNGFSSLHGKFGDFTAFQTYGVLDYLLIGACTAPFVLAYIIARGHDLTWRPGEITMIVGITAFALILVNGIILGRPGGDDPHNVDISIQIGYIVGLLGATSIAFGGFVRQAAGIKSRKPPGVL
jgi:hypothetical protein